MDIDKLR